METKICKYCQTEIPKKAKVCPQCRKKQGGGCLTKILIVLGVLIVLIIGISMIGGDDDTTSTDKDTTEAVNTDTTEAAEEEEPTTEEEKKGYIEKGESFEAKGLKITVDDTDTNYEVKDDEYGFYDLDDGLKYISATFTFENVGDSDAYVSIYDFNCYADNSSCEQKYLPEEDFINDNLSSGRNKTFTTFYAVPEDAESIELEYEANFWTDEKVIIKIK